MKDRLFISSPPGPVPLIWCNFEAVPRISGITFVRSNNWKQNSGLDYNKFYEIFSKQLPSRVPLMDIQYNEDCSEFYMEGKSLTAELAAKVISEKLNIPLGKNMPKKANNASQIVDPFHIWSRNVFDGVNVRKLDLDAVTLTEDLQAIRTMIEVKRSKAVKVGKWLPYMSQQLGNSDYWNYIISFTLCKMMSCDFITFHHENVDKDDTFKDEDKIDQFGFTFHSLISAETIATFGSEGNRVVLTAKDLV